MASTQEPNASTATSETTYEYNVQGRLEKVTTDDGTTTEYDYLYDTSGTRVRQTVSVVGGSSTVTQYLVDSNNPTGYSQVLEEKDGAGTVTKTYVLGHDVLLQAASAAAYHWLVYDGHGSTRALLDEGAALVQNGGANQLFAYTPHGELIDLSGYIGSVGDALTSLLYSGEQTDGNGQQYLRARYYDAAFGRFNRLDPFAGNFDDPQSLHKYLYTHGDPVNGIDPSGEVAFLGIAAGFAVGAALGAGLAWILNYDYDEPGFAVATAGGGLLGGATVATGSLSAVLAGSRPGFLKPAGVLFAGLLGTAYYSERNFGYDLDGDQVDALLEAQKIISQNPNFKKYSDALFSLEVRTYPFDEKSLSWLARPKERLFCSAHSQNDNLRHSHCQTDVLGLLLLSIELLPS